MYDWEFGLFMIYGSRYEGTFEVPRVTTDKYLVPVEVAREGRPMSAVDTIGENHG